MLHSVVTHICSSVCWSFLLVSTISGSQPSHSREEECSGRCPVKNNMSFISFIGSGGRLLSSSAISSSGVSGIPEYNMDIHELDQKIV